MTKSSSNAKTAMFSNLALLLSLLLILTVAESRLFEIGFPPLQEATATCRKVVGVVNGDTCLGIQEKFNLSSNRFTGINPNLNCSALFVGEWICTDGTAT